MDFSRNILDWYALNKRDLPWRLDKNPYQIWLSEIILQQTRVAQGLPYYCKFVEAFPTVNDFASAKIEDVLRLWQGLGYYSRARNMHVAANQVVSNYNGIFPSTFNELKKLKGVGDYTAAAIASIAYNEKVAVVDGNVYRVLSRYFKEPLPIDSTEGKKVFNKLANEIVSDAFPGDHNQAIMELGALVCSPRNPKCDECPLQEGCAVRFSSDKELFPQKSKKVKVTNRYFHFLHILHDHNMVIQKRNEKDIWNGLHQFPLIEKETIEDLEGEFSQLINVKIQAEVKLSGEFKHVLTHQRIFAKFYQVALSSPVEMSPDYFIIPKNELDSHALPKLMVNYLESLNKN
jgi:A/G-specific adenine glycosylase